MAYSNIKFCISGEMNGTVAALSAEGSLLRREGQPGDVTGPQGLGGWGGPRSEPLPNFDGLDNFESVRSFLLSVSLTSG